MSFFKECWQYAPGAYASSSLVIGSVVGILLHYWLTDNFAMLLTAIVAWLILSAATIQVASFHDVFRLK